MNPIEEIRCVSSFMSGFAVGARALGHEAQADGIDAYALRLNQAADKLELLLKAECPQCGRKRDLLNGDVESAK